MPGNPNYDSVLINKSGQQKSILFWSKHCQHCTKFTTALYKNQDLNNNFIKICIDSRDTVLPTWLQRVPTILVYENNKREVMTDRHAFEWLRIRLEDPGEIAEYNPAEMSSSISDCFAVIGEDGKSLKEGGDHNFAFIGEMDKHMIMTPKEQDEIHGGGSRNRASGRIGNSLETDLERYQQQRDMDLGGLKKRPPPQQPPDFTQGYKPGEERNVSQYELSRAQEQLKRDHRSIQRQQRAPNFESGAFKSQYHAQASRGGVYQPAGYGVQLSPEEASRRRNYENYLRSRGGMRRQEPVRKLPANFKKPDFTLSAVNPYKF
jgi:hypothetical protein